MDDLTIRTLRDGQNLNEPPTQLGPNQCVLAENIEWYRSTVGERRKGCGQIDLGASTLDSENMVVHLSQWYPGNDPLLTELWGAAITNGASATWAKRSTTGTWSTLSPNDAVYTSIPDAYHMQTLGLNAKLFLSYRNTVVVDRLHVWDQTSWRRTGLAAPGAAPTGANTGGAGTISGTRYYRVRYAVLSGTTVLRRSEPSTALTFTPGGANLSITITKPASISESETHWELEASIDNVNFYLLARTIVATTTVVDTTAYTTGYSALSAVSEVIGTYLTQPNAKFLSIEGDRLIMAGHWTDTTLQSQVAWSPVKNDPGVGNDERLPLNSLFNNRVSLDNYDNGPITGVTRGINGVFYVFKFGAIHRFTRTGNLLKAYEAATVTTKRGAILGSIVEAFDENGLPCVYFLDPRIGPCRIGDGGVIPILGQRTNWDRVNIMATLPCYSGYYPYKQQVKWAVAVDRGTVPALMFNVHIPYMQRVAGGVYGAWSTTTGAMASGRCMGLITEALLGSGGAAAGDRLYVGGVTPNFIVRSDVGNYDVTTAYVATLRTRPYDAQSLLQQWGMLNLALAAYPQTLQTLTLRLIRDLGLESVDATTDLLPDSVNVSEAEVIKVLDDLALRASKLLQIEFSDA